MIRVHRLTPFRAFAVSGFRDISVDRIPIDAAATLDTVPPLDHTENRTPQNWMIMNLQHTLPVSILCAVIATACSLSAAEPVDFAHDIVPILRQHCGQCHTGDKKKGGYSMNTRAALLAGGEIGAAATPGKSESSELIRRVLSRDKDEQMPPEGPRLTDKDVTLLKRWIDGGLAWEEGFALRPPTYEPPLLPRRVELPPVVDGRQNPVDRIVDAYFANQKIARPQAVGDASLSLRAGTRKSRPRCRHRRCGTAAPRAPSPCRC